MIPFIHSHVTHAKMPELGVGEVISTDGDRVLIRFASGERSFIADKVSAHLTVTMEAVPPSPSKAKASRPKKAAKAKTAAAAAKPATPTR